MYSIHNQIQLQNLQNLQNQVLYKKNSPQLKHFRDFNLPPVYDRQQVRTQYHSYLTQRDQKNQELNSKAYQILVNFRNFVNRVPSKASNSQQLYKVNQQKAIRIKNAQDKISNIKQNLKLLQQQYVTAMATVGALGSNKVFYQLKL